MKAICWYDKNDVQVEHVPDPTLLNPRMPSSRLHAPLSAAQTCISTTV